MESGFIFFLALLVFVLLAQIYSLSVDLRSAQDSIRELCQITSTVKNRNAELDRLERLICSDREIDLLKTRTANGNVDLESVRRFQKGLTEIEGLSLWISRLQGFVMADYGVGNKPLYPYEGDRQWLFSSLKFQKHRDFTFVIFEQDGSGKTHARKIRLTEHGVFLAVPPNDQPEKIPGQTH